MFCSFRNLNCLGMCISCLSKHAILWIVCLGMIVTTMGTTEGNESQFVDYQPGKSLISQCWWTWLSTSTPEGLHLLGVGTSTPSSTHIHMALGCAHRCFIHALSFMVTATAVPWCSWPTSKNWQIQYWPPMIKIHGLFKDFQGPYSIFSSTKIVKAKCNI